MCPYGRDAYFRLVFLEGEGTEDSPYLVSTAEQLNMIGMLKSELDKQYRLAADIDLSGYDCKEGRPAFNMIGDCWTSGPTPMGFVYPVGTPFTGVFDGNSHKISHLTINVDENYVGLFQWLESGGQVKDLRIVDVNVTCRYAGGALVGSNEGIVNRCYSSGAVSGESSVGGLAGCNNGGTITDCYNTGRVSGSSLVGGLVGWNGKTYSRRQTTVIAHCYSAGNVTCTGKAGGLAGSNYLGEVAACFWDTQTSGQTTSDGGTGKTTSEMQTAKTFLDAGWDFVGETENGTEDIWWILEGKDYPHLWWEAK